jgi:hypothetical protein
VTLTNQGVLELTADAEVGAVTATGGTGGGYVALGAVGTQGSLNASDGNPVSVSGGVVVLALDGKTGPLSITGGTLQVGTAPDTTSGPQLAVAGAATLDSTDQLAMFINHAGTTAGTDFSQLTATGNVNLGGAALSVSGGTAICPALHVGDVDTLVKATGALTGTFTGIANGMTVALGCTAGVEPTVRINYTANAVTATVLTAGGPPAVKSVTPDAGPTGGGNTVIIKGVGFVPCATVLFGSTASSSVTFVSSTEVKAVAPAEASGVVNVTLTCDGITTAKSKADLYAYGPPTVTSFTPTSGITGSSVTLTGTNFVPAAKVKFATLASPKVTFVSPTTLKAIVPNGAVPGQISVTTSAGTGTGSATFTPTLSITGFSPGSGPVGTVVTITGVGFTSTSTVKFNATAASSVTFVSTSELKATVPTGATTGPITVTNSAAPAGTVRSAANFTVT